MWDIIKKNEFGGRVGKYLQNDYLCVSPLRHSQIERA